MQKLDLQSGGMKSKLILHIEKIVFGVAVLLVVTFIYFGAQREGISVTPDQVKQVAEQASATINNSEWTPVEKKRWTDPVYEQRAELAQNPINISNYAAMSEFGPPMYQSIQKRIDPKVLTVEKLEAKSGFAPFVYDDKRMAGLAGGRGEMMDAGGYGGGMEYGPGGRQSKDMPPVMTPEQQKRFGPARATAGTRIEGKHFVVITGLIPFEKQWDEFDAALLDAAGYDPQRDVPKYIGFGVRRREMSPDGKWGEYKDLVPQLAFADAIKWAFRPEEVIPPEYAHPLLTFPIAPMLLVDPAEYARHSEVPKWLPAMQGGMMGEGGYGGVMGEYGGMETADGVMPTPQLPEFNADSAFFPGFANQGGRGGMGEGGFPGGMGAYGGMPGYGGAGEMMEGRGAGRRVRGGRGGMGGGMYGGEGGMGGGASGYSKEKMFRFYDTTVKGNTQYQYQVNLWLEDPNNPVAPLGGAQQRGGSNMAPSSVTLSRETLARIAQKKQEAGKDPVKLSKASRLETDYSKPSSVVKTTIESTVLAGNVKTGREQRSNDGANRLLNSREPQATVLGVAWDEAEGLLSTQKISVERGDSVNVVDDLWTLNPGTLMFDKKEDYEMKTNAVVLDMRGGDTLPGRYRDPAENEALVSPGEILVMDARGNISIHKELKDRNDFSLFDFTPPEVKKTSGGSDDPYGYGEGMEEGGRRGRGRGRGE
ncbi:hypothetical protein M4951_21320 [Blastopirellula sp. J2-11]|uniref:hypothetical protein n=1 Tax=Blastopirellula sp. J2-11 TaxID=2943192 RepID=UPI0021C92C7D|nr:hypothetical protein [Blastopirellula sp. J2-11]UUO05895.1 hypothetical protein M4951_21320 [Blastopirellula sp. J2-11]